MGIGLGPRFIHVLGIWIEGHNTETVIGQIPWQEFEIVSKVVRQLTVHML